MLKQTETSLAQPIPVTSFSSSSTAWQGPGREQRQPDCHMPDVTCPAGLGLILPTPLGATLTPLFSSQVHPPALPPGG